MVIDSVTFVRSIASRSQFGESPAQGEIAVVGRSNVGKSSLINFIAGKTVARTSRTPGRTRLINLFLVNDSFLFVDLPGYGFAGGDPNERREWPALISTYVGERPSVAGVLALIDSRHFPLPIDMQAIAWLEAAGKPYVVVFTKVDKLNQKERAALERAVRSFVAAHPLARGPVYTSVLKNIGRKELSAAVSGLLHDPIAVPVEPLLP